jgi:hypothetical protein
MIRIYDYQHKKKYKNKYTHQAIQVINYRKKNKR